MRIVDGDDVDVGRVVAKDVPDVSSFKNFWSEFVRTPCRRWLGQDGRNHLFQPKNIEQLILHAIL